MYVYREFSLYINFQEMRNFLPCFRLQSPSSFRKHLVFMVAVDRSNLTLSAAEYVHHEGLGRVVAGTINMVSDSHFYGRYWGAFSYHNNLHFEVCYYKVRRLFMYVVSEVVV
jgi:predicted N-acyltransferase